MSRVCLVILIIIILLLFLSLTAARVRFCYSRWGWDDKLTLGFSLWSGLFYYQFELPAIQMKKKKRWNVSNIVKDSRIYSTAFYYLLEKVQLRRFSWRTEIGAGDPCQTGLITGAAWGVKGFILTVIYRLISPGGARPVVEITPNFEKTCFNTVLDCIFEIRLGYLFITGFKAFLLRYR
ncbi:MAG: hypothetical protein A4E55_00416 [Pelotomaculum sp. PtaU1.Bin035]|nr:MAG: hypothetical protein A4E55_00416 [Pelotomaculum sp. PtaU1.Bin035]